MRSSRARRDAGAMSSGGGVEHCHGAGRGAVLRYPVALVKRICVFIATGLVGLFAACGSTPAPGPDTSQCYKDPYSCPMGQTCWPMDTSPRFSCLPGEPTGAFKSSCMNTLGKATCAAGLACDQSGMALAGTCTPYCDTQNHPCPAGYSCRATHVAAPDGPLIQVCRPGEDDQDAGDLGLQDDAGQGDLDASIDPYATDATVDGRPHFM